MVKKLWNKNFILLLQSSIVSTIGDIMYSFAIGIWVYSETQSTSLMAIMSAISMFVSMFLSPFSGSIVDKCNRKMVIIVGDFFQGIIMLTIGTLAFFNKLSVTAVLIAAFLAALGGVFYSPAVSTILLDIIPHDDMVRGQSIFSGSSSLLQMIGSSLSGVLVVVLGVPLIIIINGLSNIYAAISEMFLKVPKSVQEGNPVTISGILNDTKSALKTIFSDPCLKLFIPFALLLNVLTSGIFTLTLPLIKQKGFGEDQYGYIVAIFTAGSLVAVLILGIIKLSAKARFWSMAIGFVAAEICLIIAFLSKDFAVMCIFTLAGAFLNTVGNSIFSASLMVALPEENRGALLGFISFSSVGGSAISSVIYGFLGEFFPVYIISTVGTMLSVVPMLYYFFHPKTKEFILSH